MFYVYLMRILYVNKKKSFFQDLVQSWLQVFPLTWYEYFIEWFVMTIEKSSDFSWQWTQGWFDIYYKAWILCSPSAFHLLQIKTGSTPGILGLIYPLTKAGIPGMDWIEYINTFLIIDSANKWSPSFKLILQPPYSLYIISAFVLNTPLIVSMLSMTKLDTRLIPAQESSPKCFALIFSGLIIVTLYSVETNNGPNTINTNIDQLIFLYWRFGAGTIFLYRLWWISKYVSFGFEFTC